MVRHSLAALVAASIAAPVAADDIWDGFYFGGQLGFGIGSADILNRDTSTTWAAVDQRTDFEPEGGIIGVHAGRNFFDGPFVYGFEVSADFADISQRIVSPYLPANHDYEVSIDNRISISGRYGQTIEGWTLYGRAGYTGGDVTFRGIDTAFPQNAYEQTGWHNGWHFGVGAEREVADNVSIGFDLTHSDLGSRVDNEFWTTGGVPVVGDPQSFEVNAAATVFSLRLSYSY